MTRRSLFRALLAAPLAAVGVKAAVRKGYWSDDPVVEWRCQRIADARHQVVAGPGFERGVWDTRKREFIRARFDKHQRAWRRPPAANQLVPWQQAEDDLWALWQKHRRLAGLP